MESYESEIYVTSSVSVLFSMYIARDSIPSGNPQHANHKRKFRKGNKVQLYKKSTIRSLLKRFSKVEWKCIEGRFCNCRKYQIQNF